MVESFEDLKIKFTTALHIQEMILLGNESSLISKTMTHDYNNRRFTVPGDSTANLERSLLFM